MKNKLFLSNTFWTNMTRSGLDQPVGRFYQSVINIQGYSSPATNEAFSETLFNCWM